jgi:hypothetical protein
MVPVLQFGIKLGPVDRGRVSEAALRAHPVRRRTAAGTNGLSLLPPCTFAPSARAAQVWADRTLLSLTELPDPSLSAHQVTARRVDACPTQRGPPAPQQQPPPPPPPSRIHPQAAYVAFLNSRVKHEALVTNTNPAKAIKVGTTVVPVTRVVTAPPQVFDAAWYAKVRAMATFAADAGAQYMRWVPSAFLTARAEAAASGDMNYPFRVRQTAFLATSAAMTTRRYFLGSGHARQITATAQASVMVDAPLAWPEDVVRALPTARATTVTVLPVDVIAAAAQLQAEGATNVLVAVDANHSLPGDGVHDGQVSAETDFAIRTNWLAAVDRSLNSSARPYAIPDFGVVYARGISAFRGPESEGEGGGGVGGWGGGVPGRATRQAVGLLT